jgi:hypothetical protein
MQTSAIDAVQPASAERRLQALGIQLPAPPEPFGTHSEALQTGNLLFLIGMLPTEGCIAKITGRVGAELDSDRCREAAFLAALNALAVARPHLRPLDRVTRVVRPGVLVATSGDVRDQPKVADGASNLFERPIWAKQEPEPEGLWRGKPSARNPIELEVIFEVEG